MTARPVQQERWRVIQGDALASLKALPDGCVRCCVTSPPYWGLRDYGVSGQLGLEATPEAYVASMVAVFAEVRRVLADDGTLWLNLGDSYATGAGKVGDRPGGGAQGDNWPGAKTSPNRMKLPGLKSKDLIGIPWRVAFALQADGWYLRSEIIWAKPNGMPESVTDRPTTSHEKVFLLSKAERYFYDGAAVRTPPAPSSETRLAQDVEAQAGSERANGGGRTNGPMKAVRRADKQRGHSRRHDGFNDRWDAMTKQQQQQMGANLRTVWWLAPAQFKGAHYAVMPEKLARICVLAGSEPGDLILDPFAGSGTTGAVAVSEARRFVGVELAEANVALASDRIADAAAQGSLFAVAS